MGAAAQGGERTATEEGKYMIQLPVNVDTGGCYDTERAILLR